jgi:cholesterol transport system auxiliary component
MRMRWLFAMTTMVLSGCMGSPAQRPEARFDFGPLPAAAAAATGVAGVEVMTPSWLDGDAMQYRLLYADAAQRLDYAESRWVAPPAELLGLALENRLAANGRGHCRLLVDLNEFVQVFDSPSASHFRLDARATLLADHEIVANQGFSETQPAPTADARGGVAAAATTVRLLGDALASWLAGQGSRCRAG